MASTASTYSNIDERRNRYFGDLLNQKRHGYGAYYYPNPFFKYEGEWLNGKKHGHGKLIMADGSYYEGEFKDGEICGKGFKKWQSSGNTYTGSFVLGELDGEGVLDYNDEEAQYSGEFSRNMRQGDGVLRERFGKEYVGGFYNNKRHGKGKQLFSNGDYYDGDWVNGQRQGHGLLNCMNGGYYEGQWRSDMFNGFGKLIHPSGVSFEGIWLNDLPLQQASRLSLLQPSTGKILEIKQNELFTLRLEIVDEEGNPIKGEIGRRFEIKAGHRNPFHITKSVQQNSLLKIIEDHGESANQIFTPFGYNVLNYPLTEIPEELVEEFNRLHNPVNARESFEDISDTETDIDDTKRHSMTQKADEDKNEKFPHLNMTALSIIQSDEMNKTEPQNANISNYIRSFENILPKTSNSEEPLQFSNLFLPNPRDLFSDLIKDPEDKEEDKNSKKNADDENDLNGDEFLENRKRNKQGANGKKRSLRGNIRPAIGKRNIKGLHKINKDSSQDSVSRLEQIASYKEELKAKTEKFINRLAVKGDYVIIISDVTTPPFLGYHLPDFFLEVKVMQPSQEEDIKNKSH